MRLKDLFVRPKSPAVQTAEIVTDAVKELVNQLESTSAAEIKSKDRVDITLDEYLHMRDEIERTSRELRHARCLLTSLGIPPEVISSIDPDTIRVCSNKDLRDFKCYYHVAFAVDETKFI